MGKLTEQDFFLSKEQKKKYPSDKIIMNWLQYSIDHVIAAKYLLLTDDMSVMDSAALLTHYGFELFLKTCLLQEFSEIKKEHDLLNLLTKIEQYKLTKQQLSLLKQIDNMFCNRYPLDKHTYDSRKNDIQSSQNDMNIPLQVGEIDTNILEDAQELYQYLLSNAPEKIRKLHKEINPLAKGNRVLMKKKKE